MFIRFIDEKILLEAIEGIDETNEMCLEERRRNEFGQSERFKYDPQNHVLSN